MHHSPLSAFDAYGLVGEAYRDGWNVATNPNYFDGISNEYSPVFGENAGNDAWASVQWQETKENLYTAFAGIVHGCFDFIASNAYLFQSLAFAAGCDGLECSLEEKIQIQQAFAISQSNQIAATDAFVQQTMGIDANNATYQAFRSGTTTTLEIASIAMVSYGLAKGAVGVVGLLEAKMANQALKQEAKTISKTGMSSNQGATTTIKVSEVSSNTKTVADDRIWTFASPFKNKTAQELHEMFIKKGYIPKGTDPMNGRGRYINPRNNREYHIDPQSNDRYREVNYVDVMRLENYEGGLPKKRMAYHARLTKE